MKKLWNDESGAVLSAELVLLMTILGIGMIVGMKALQSAVVNELGDVAAAIGAVDQTYSVNGVSGCCASTAGSQMTDAKDKCDLEADQTNSGNVDNLDVCGIEAAIESN